MKYNINNPWLEVPKIDGIGLHRLMKIKTYLESYCPEYSFLILKKGTLMTTGNLRRDTLYIRKRDK